MKYFLSNFKKNAIKANSILKEKGFTLDFTGYDATITEYVNMLEEDIYSNKKLAIELNFWANYMSETINIVIFFKNMIIDELDYLNALENKDEELKKQIKLKEKQIKLLKQFINILESQKNFFEKAFYHTRKNLKKEIFLD